MAWLLLVLLGTAFSHVDTRVHLDSEGWIVDAKSPAARSQWQWSAQCAPQKLRSGEPFTCGASRALQVSVVDLKGRAVRNARVLWATEEMLRELPDQHLPNATTTDDGRAVIPAASTQDIWIRVAGPELGTFWSPLRCDESELRLRAAPVVPLRLRLRGDDDKPVTRGRVALLPPNCTSLCAERLLAFDGDPEPPRLFGVAGSSYKLVAWSDSHAPMTRTVAFATPSDLTLNFERGAALSARIVDRERKPLASARLDVHFQLPALRQAIRRSVSAGADGTVRLDGLPAASVEWAASATGAGRRTNQFSLTTGGTDLGEIVLQPARRATVHVVDRANLPVSEARIVARGSGYVLTNDKGAATFQELPVDDVSLEVTAEGFLPATTIAGKDETDVRVRMERGAGIKATLLRESDSRPPASVRVRITNNGTESIRSFDVEQGLTVSGLRTGSARLRITGDGIEPYDSGDLDVAEGNLRDLGIVMLKTGAVVRGVVAEASGAPIREARIRALHTEGDAPALAHVLGHWSEVTSGEDGAFRMSGLTRGAQFLTIDAPGFAQRAISNLTIDGSGSELDLGTIELSRGTRVELICRPAQQCGTEASVLTAGPEFPFAAIHAPLEHGRGTFVGVPPGAATLRLTRAKHVVHERSIELRANAESTTIEIELPSLKLRGEVILGSGRANEGSLLLTRAVRATGVPILTRSQTPQGSTVGTEWLGTFGAATYVNVANGAFFVDGIEPGEYDVVFRTGASSTAPVRLELPDVGEHTVRLRFEDREIAGIVRDAEERPALARVEVVDGTGATHVTNSGLDGSFRLLGVGAGKANIRATASGRKAEMAVDPSTQAARNVVLRLTEEDRRGFAITVRESRGQPAAGVLVFLTEKGGMRAASTDHEGRAVFRSVEDSGTCAVAVHRLGGEWAFGSVHAGAAANIVLPERVGTVVAEADGITGAAFITTPDGFPLDRVLPMVGISTHLGSAGSLRLAGLPAGTYSVRMGMSQKVATVSAGETTRVRFEQ